MMEAGSINGMMLQHSISEIFETTAREHLSYWARNQEVKSLVSWALLYRKTRHRKLKEVLEKQPPALLWSIFLYVYLFIVRLLNQNVSTLKQECCAHL